MNCEKCQKLLSDYIDGELGSIATRRVRTHLSVCAPCAAVHEDFIGITRVCAEKAEAEIAPPNAQALWCRINNIIESEVKPEIERRQEEKRSRKSFFARAVGASWQMSLTQMAAVVIGIALISSLLTFVVLKAGKPNDFQAAVSVEPNVLERALRKVGLMQSPKQAREEKLRQQELAIDYWNKRVQEKRAQWDKHLREAFDRNLREIDQALFEYTQNLENNPDDELSVEMIDSALNEKMELLREFSEL